MLPVTSEAMSAAKINAPQDYWSRLAVLKYDNGAPNAISSECMLRCVRCRGVITVDPKKTGDVVLDHRKEMAQVPVVLPMSESRVYEALRDVSRYNSTVVGLSGNSAAAKTALQPDCFWSVNQIRRGVDVGYDSWQLSNQNRGSGTEAGDRGTVRRSAAKVPRSMCRVECPYY